MSESDDEYAAERAEMVDRQIARRDVDDENVLEAMREVPRHEFVPSNYGSMAYADRPLPIGDGQTISQPYIVAMMTEAAEVEPGDHVLEIGAGSGYGAAVLGEIAERVVTVERKEELADEARERLESLGYSNVEVVVGDGTKGWPEEAPYDAILATASGPEVPESFREQLAVGGAIVMPVGSKRGGQRLTKVVRESEENYREEDLGFVRFVPLIGDEGWEPDESTGASQPGSSLLDF